MKQKERQQQKNPGQMMLYATNGSIVKSLVEDREYNANKNHEIARPSQPLWTPLNFMNPESELVLKDVLMVGQTISEENRRLKLTM